MTNTVRQLVALGLPMAIGFVSQMLISFTDAALIARVGATELAGTTLALSLFSIVMLAGLGIITAVSPRVAEAYEAGDADGVRGWFVQGTWLAVLLGGIGVAVLQATGPILRLLGQSAEVADIAQRYNRGAAIGIVFFFLAITSRCVMGAVGRPAPLTVIMLAAVPVNLVVAWIFIFGTPVTPAGGVLGAGISSSLVRLLIAVAAYALLLRGRAFADLGLRSAATAVRWRSLAGLSALGLPIGVRILLAEGFLPVIAFFVAQYGADPTAAHAIALRLQTLITVFALGFSSAATTLAAWRRSAGDWRGLRRLQHALLLVALGYAALVAPLVVVAFPRIQTDVFGLDDASVARLLALLLPWMVAAFALDAIGTGYNGFLVGMLDTRIPTLMVAISYWVIGLGVGLGLASAGMGFVGLWVGLAVAALVMAVFNYSRASMHVRRLRG